MLLFVILDVSFWDLISDIPHDAEAFVAYGVLALIGVFIWLGSRTNKPEE